MGRFSTHRELCMFRNLWTQLKQLQVPLYGIVFAASESTWILVYGGGSVQMITASYRLRYLGGNAVVNGVHWHMIQIDDHESDVALNYMSADYGHAWD